MSNQVTPVLPPKGACCANDLWDIVLPVELETVNHNTHAFDWMEGRCVNCDSRSGGQWARFACQHSFATQAISFEEWNPA